MQDNTYTDDLLKKLIKINEEQNKLLDKNNSTSEKFNILLLIIASISFLAAFASTQISAQQLLTAENDSTGMIIFVGMCVLVGILEILAWVSFFYPPKKLRERT